MVGYVERCMLDLTFNWSIGMTVKELITALSLCDETAEVFIRTWHDETNVTVLAIESNLTAEGNEEKQEVFIEMS